MLTKRMAMRRMNEMWRRMALTLLFCGLLFDTCQGQTEQTSVTSQPGSTQSYPGDPTDTSTAHAPSSTANVTIPDFTDTFTSTIRPVIATQNTSRSLQTYTTTKDAAQALTTATTKAVTYHGVNNITEIMNKSSINQNKNLNSGTEGPEGPHNEKTRHDVSKLVQPKVFVSILVIGLILAAALFGAYVWKNHCHRKTTGMKLAEESYMGDDANQGNTLVSVAPLNPPESQEKPSQNGESLEAVKTQNPPAATNGHSTTKADTEL